MGSVAQTPEPGHDPAGRVTGPLPDFCRDPSEPLAEPTGPVGRLEEGRCSVQALLRGDAATATAPPAVRWLLIEQPGPWGPEALTDSRFDPAVASRLAARAAAEGVRVQLVRRSGDRLADSGRRWALADTTPGREVLHWSTRDADADLLEVPWDGSVGSASDVPTYLVCTHGAHDACCAVRGRPLARSLTGSGPVDVWETSHLGGDRFAANVLVLPHGLLYGQVPGNGAELVRAHERGQVALPWLRGRAGIPAAAQAAQQHARAELDLLGIDDLPVRAVRRLPAEAPVERWEVDLGGPSGDVVVTVESRLTEGSALLTCRARRPNRWRTWHPLSLRVAAPA
ncbi:sucrase ferredoxin [Modestobacter marinus]|uniref:sucrase ferredoxin n=1 Tax=Modestobacter marinus TaxID=477641 RepID=UPI001C96E7F0|nr:sucrase ferredoxin [Modestobacter marinus]